MKPLRMALAGNANVGKSAVFNHLTGMHQHVGNWPGKTVEKKEGTFFFAGRLIDIIDLPGIYSFSTFSLEERVSRDYIAKQKPDVVINVIDATLLERNLFFTLQLIELDTPMVIALNMVDEAKRKGIVIDCEKLSKKLGVPVVPTVATRGKGITNLVAEAIKVATGKKQKHMDVEYGKEVEEKVASLEKLFPGSNAYPPRWLAVKLLEEDPEILKSVEQSNPTIAKNAGDYSKQLQKIHGECCSMIVSCERYNVAARIAKEVIKRGKPEISLSNKLDHLTTHPVFGYPVLLAVLLSLFMLIFSFGDFLSGWLNALFENAQPLAQSMFGSGLAYELVWSAVDGLIAGITIALPYIIPFYFVLSVIEDSGYLSRVAFLTDNFMHKIGLHGKACIPLLLGYGCNVPACLSCRIMERYREKFITAFLTTLIPCAARTVIIMGLVAAFVGLKWALFLYAFNLVVIIALGKILNKFMPGEPVGLIMEMHDYRKPSLRVAAKQAWFQVKEFIAIAFPIIIVSSFVIKLLELAGILDAFSSFASPLTEGWLGLPAVVGIILVFGILRKELALVILATVMGTTSFGDVLTPLQMITLALVSMLYIPCIATIAALKKEFGWRKALAIAVFEIVFAIVVAGVVMRILAATFF